MERFTIKNERFNDYSVAEELRQLDVRDYLYSINQKMGKLEDIMDKYKVKDLEELELMISTYIDNRGEY